MPPLSTLGMSGPISTLTGGGATGLVTEDLVLNLVAFDTNSWTGSGSTWYDLSSQNQHSTIYGASSSTVGNGGSGTGSFLFDGYNDRVECGTITGFANNLTLEAWVRLTSMTGDDGDSSFIIQGGGSGLRYDFKTSGNYLQFRIGGSAAGTLGTSSTVSTNTWYHLVGTWNGSSLNFYLNNSLQGTTTHSYTLPSSIVTDLGRYRIDFPGPIPSENAGQLNGYLSVVRIYQKALTASEVSQNFNLDKSRFGY